MAEEHAADSRAAWQGPIAEGVWGALAGLVGSLCCIGPSAAILLGLGSSSALFGLQVDQRLALGGGMLMLFGGCGIALRRSHICNVPPRDRWRQVALMLVPGILAYLLLGILAPLAALRHEAATPVVRIVAPATAAQTLRRATLLMEKMDCPPCVAHLRSLLARKPFVAQFAADTGNDSGNRRVRQ